MVLLEIGAIIIFAGVVSACAICACPNCLGGKASQRMMIFSQKGSCSYVLLPSDRDNNRMRNARKGSDSDNELDTFDAFDGSMDFRRTVPNQDKRYDDRLFHVSN